MKGNAEDGYEQSRWESLLLNEGWRFRGMPVLSTGPWKAWVFMIGAVLMLVLVGAYLSLGLGIDLTEWGG